MPDWFIYLTVLLLAVSFLGCFLHIRKSRELTQFLNSVADPVGKDYFDRWSETAVCDAFLQYGDSVIPGSLCASKEGVYLESVLRFHVLIPWEIITAIRVIGTNGKLSANLRIQQGNELNRQLTVSWDSAIHKYIPETVIVVKG